MGQLCHDETTAGYFIGRLWLGCYLDIVQYVGFDYRQCVDVTIMRTGDAWCTEQTVLQEDVKAGRQFTGVLLLKRDAKSWQVAGVFDVR